MMQVCCASRVMAAPLLLALVLVRAHTALAGEWPNNNNSGHHNNNNNNNNVDEVQAYTNAILNVTYTDSSGSLHSNKWEQGRFGRGHVGQSSGVLVHLGRKDAGCSPLQKIHVPSGEPWIALVERSGCVEDKKVENAWLNNAAAVVFYNSHDSLPLEKLHLYENKNISSVLIPKQRGEELIRLVENGTRVYLTIFVGAFVQKHYTNINRTSVLFVSISFIVLMIISLAWLVFYYVQRFRYIHAKDRLSRRLCSAAKKALSKIPTKNIKSEDKEIQGDGECCAVCIEPYKVSDVLRILPCKHEFHRSCIDPWLLEHRTCPMCKMDILKHYGFVFTGSQESILHMDIEEVFGIATDDLPDTDSLHRRSISPMPHIRPVENQQASSPASPELQSHSSRASSPDEMSPSLSSDKCLMQGAESSADAVPSALKGCTCGSDMAARTGTTCKMNSCANDEAEDCEVVSCNSSTSGTSPPPQSRSLTK